VGLQGYWIYSAWEDKEEEFSLAVQQSLQLAADEIQERELSDYIQAYENLIDSLETPDNASFANVFLFLDEDKPNNLLSYYAYGILEEDYKITPYLDPKLGDNQRIRSIFKDYTSNTPIHKRLNSQELDFVLKRQFDSKNIITPYEFGIYDDGLATKIKSNNYLEEQQGFKYKTPIFRDQDGLGRYELVVSFPEKDQYVFSSIIGVGGLTLFLTLFIVLVSTSALYQIIQQKKLSEIKTDFINNMSHEFKTPIATINLALDAISNPKTKLIPEKVERYVSMIREENSRMLTQVENVLRISQLERSSNPIKMSKVDLHAIIKDAISHIELILNDKSGSLTKKLKASNVEVLGNKSHLTNITVNLLDNALKYCDSTPKIIVETFNEDGDFVLKVTDNGFGMSPVVQKKIFDKFYRATSGNIHNVKGHGLGLAYVKKIVDIHKGEIKLESKENYGTTFEIRLPLE